MFKVAAAIGLGGAAITGAIWGITYFGPIKDFDNANLSGTTFSDTKVKENIGEGSCGDGKFEASATNGSATNAANANSKFDKACSGYKRTRWLVPTTIALGLVGTAALVYVLVSRDNSDERISGRQKKKNRNLIVTPVVTPDGTGATLRFDW